MRDPSAWNRNLVRCLKKQWPENEMMRPSELCNIELGPHLLSQLAPDAPAKALWVLLTGYPFPASESQNWNRTQRNKLGNARHLLPYFRDAYQWERALERHRRLDERLRVGSVQRETRQTQLRNCSKLTDFQILSPCRKPAMFGAGYPHCRCSENLKSGHPVLFRISDFRPDRVSRQGGFRSLPSFCRSL